ncbi:MAG: porin family protein [Candidatus Eisenbacteria bacterium]
MKKRVVLLSLPLLICLGFTSALVQGEMGGAKWGFGFDAGYAMPMGDFGDGFDGAITVGANACYMFTEQYALELAVGWNKHTCTDDEDWTFQLMPVSLNFMAGFPTGGKLIPYVKGGVGMYSEKIEYKLSGVSISDTESDFGFNAGGGVKFPVAETTLLDVGVRLHHILTEDEATQYVTATIGVGFMF